MADRRTYGFPAWCTLFRLRWIACWLLATSCVADGSPPEVTIEGGADVSGHLYSWTVTNESTEGGSPIVSVKFPHYRASLFFVPEEWSTDCTFLVNVGVKDTPGVCTASVDSPAKGIGPGRSARFNMRIDAAGARRASGKVLVRFADGTEATVTGVELPQPETTGEKYTSLIGLGLVLAVAVIVQRRRARRRLPEPRPPLTPPGANF